MQALMALESSTVLQFSEAATKAVATVEVIERSPVALRDAILRAGKRRDPHPVCSTAGAADVAVQ